MKRHISLLSGGRDSPPSVYLSRRPRRPTCCGWIRRRRSPFIRLETFGSSQPSVKACLHAAGCFLQELIPTAAGPTSHHTQVVCRDKHLTLTTGAESVRLKTERHVSAALTGSDPESSRLRSDEVQPLFKFMLVGSRIGILMCNQSWSHWFIDPSFNWVNQLIRVYHCNLKIFGLLLWQNKTIEHLVLGFRKKVFLTFINQYFCLLNA